MKKTRPKKKTFKDLMNEIMTKNKTSEAEKIEVRLPEVVVLPKVKKI